MYFPLCCYANIAATAADATILLVPFLTKMIVD